MKRRSTGSAVDISKGDRDDDSGLSKEIAGLGGLDIDGLRLKWRARLGRAAPAHLPKHLLVRILAYRLQAEAYGDLDRESARMLARIATQVADRRAGRAPSGEGIGPIVVSVEASPGLKLGTMLAREHGGAMHRVMVLRDGFAWNGATYSSLSDVARAITGTKWNGPRFFGLRDQKRSSAMTKAVSTGPAVGNGAGKQPARSRGALVP